MLCLYITFNTMCSMTRQSDYKPEYDDMVLEWLAEGNTLRSFAVNIGVSSATLYNWRENQSFLDAIKKGRKVAHEIYAEQFLYDNLENQKVNNVMAILYCRNVLGIKTKDDDTPPPPPVEPLTGQSVEEFKNKMNEEC